VSDPLNNWFGRRGEIFITSIILIATPIASGFTHSWEALLATRLVMGLGLGAKGEEHLNLTFTGADPYQPLLYPCTPLRWLPPVSEVLWSWVGSCEYTLNESYDLGTDALQMDRFRHLHRFLRERCRQGESIRPTPPA
jgi:hypothetical protein